MTFHLASSWARVVTGNICIFLMQCLFNKFLPPDTLKRGSCLSIRIGSVGNSRFRDPPQSKQAGDVCGIGEGSRAGKGKDSTSHHFFFFVYTISECHLFNF